MNRRILASAVFALAAASGLAYVPLNPPEVTLPAEPKVSDAKTLARDNARFAFDLYKQLAKSDGNVFFSPHSISTALAMTSVGAADETAAEVAWVMRWSQAGDMLHDSFASLTRQLTPPKADHPSKTYQWTEANRLWLGMPVLPAFNDRLKVSYAADAGTLDKDPAKSAAMINAWTDTHTNHRIKDLVSASDLTDAKLVLTNAVFFKGSWVSPFSASSTAPRDFHISTGITIKPATMADVRFMSYARNDAASFAAVQVPYQGGVSFIVILPDEGQLAKVEQSLSADSFAATSKSFRGTLVDFQLPKFKFQTRQSLKQQFDALGMSNAFSDKAAFKKMAKEPMKISDVIHVADVELDEKGTEAAAATAVPMAPTSAAPSREDPPKPVIFHADCPFIFMIRHDATGEILFAGRMSDPR
jgi:serpin B